MRRLSRGLDVAAPAAVVWRLIAEFRHWPTWGPTVRAVKADADMVATGVRGRVQTPLGIWLPFEITDVVDGHSWDWRVGGVPATGHRVTPTGPTTCRVEFTVPWVAAPYLAVVRIGLRRLVRLAESAATAG